MLLHASLAAEPTLHPYSATYTVHLNGFKVGELERSLEHLDNGGYQLETRAYTTGMVAWFKPDVVTEVSRWQYDERVPRPISYSYHYSGRKSDRHERQDFDWDKGVIHSLRGGETSQLELEEGMVDKQLFEIAMQQALREGLSSKNYQVISRGRITEYEFRVLGKEEVVSRPLGTITTIKVQRGEDTLMWLSPAHDYLVVKIEHTDDDNVATSYLSQLQNEKSGD
jgi:hypothetical protein